MKQDVIVQIPRQNVSYSDTLELATVNLFVANMVKYTPNSSFFMFNNCKVVAPSLGSGTDNTKRVQAVFQSLNTAIFADVPDAETILPEEDPRYAWFERLNEMGIHASVCSKAAINRAISLWAKEKASTIKLQEKETDALNASRILRINQNRDGIKVATKHLEAAVSKLLLPGS